MLEHDRTLPFGELLAHRRFIIPVWQRPYDWNENQWAALLRGLRTSTQALSEHHLGYATVAVAGDDCPQIVVDGQQRLRTLSMFLRVLEHNDKCVPEDFVVGEYDRLDAARVDVKLRDWLEKELRGGESERTALAQSIRERVFLTVGEILPGPCADAVQDPPEKIGEFLRATNMSEATQPSAQEKSVPTDDRLIRKFESLNRLSLATNDLDRIKANVIFALSEDEAQAFGETWAKLKALVETPGDMPVELPDDAARREAMLQRLLNYDNNPERAQKRLASLLRALLAHTLRRSSTSDDAVTRRKELSAEAFLSLLTNKTGAGASIRDFARTVEDFVQIRSQSRPWLTLSRSETTAIAHETLKSLLGNDEETESRQELLRLQVFLASTLSSPWTDDKFFTMLLETSDDAVEEGVLRADRMLKEASRRLWDALDGKRYNLKETLAAREWFLWCAANNLLSNLSTSSPREAFVRAADEALQRLGGFGQDDESALRDWVDNGVTKQKLRASDVSAEIFKLTMTGESLLKELRGLLFNGNDHNVNDRIAPGVAGEVEHWLAREKGGDNSSVYEPDDIANLANISASLNSSLGKESIRDKKARVSSDCWPTLLFHAATANLLREDFNQNQSRHARVLLLFHGLFWHEVQKTLLPEGA